MRCAGDGRRPASSRQGRWRPASVYTIGTDAEGGKLALFLLQTQMNRRVRPDHPARQPVPPMKEGIKTADAYLQANLKNLGITTT